VRPVPCLIGQTGCGKSDVAIHLARATRGEVIACDAFTVYRGMEILTAAPAAPHDVPHHLVGILDPARERFDAAAFAAAADDLVASISARGGTPWIVGGSALYLRGWLKGFGPPVERDEAYRARLEALAARRGPPRLHALLARADPARAAELHPNDTRRVVRALEILRATGRPASAFRGDWAGPDLQPAVVVRLCRRPQDLDDRIRRRVDAMFGAGVRDEARRLLAGDLLPEARKVLGLDVLARLLAGELDEAAAREALARKTRRYAKKQQTFFDSFEGVRILDVGADESAERVASRILAELPAQLGGTSA
jgi:tRNA dimethylallyltransferase